MGDNGEGKEHRRREGLGCTCNTTQRGHHTAWGGWDAERREGRERKVRAGSREERRGRQMTDRQVWRDDDVQRRQRGESVFVGRFRCDDLAVSSSRSSG